LTLSTGYPRLDNACQAGFREQHMKPAIRDGKPTTVTVEMPVVWKLTLPGQVPINVDPKNMPRIGRKYYPAESMRLHEDGICVVKVKVSAGGDVQALSLTHSTGFPGSIKRVWMPSTMGGCCRQP
jgi:outer membrane biosynthesis protein TonB